MQTKKIILREWKPEADAEQAFAIYGDREVMRYVGDGSTSDSIEAARDRLQQRIDDFRELNNGTGFWAIVERQTQEPVGTILLKQLPDNDGNLTEDIEIGWHLRRSSWGKGYVTEAAREIIAYGFNELKLPILYAVVKPENTRSIAVTQRLGMKSLGFTNNYYGVELLLFQLEPN